MPPIGARRVDGSSGSRRWLRWPVEGPPARIAPQIRMTVLGDLGDDERRCVGVLPEGGHTPLVLFAGKEYGSGSSRDWAAKGPNLMGVRAAIAESFERIHRSNLMMMGSSRSSSFPARR